MATLIEMPKLSDTMETGKILTWIKQEGEKVEAGEVIAEVETDKATMELECFENGTLLKILAQPDMSIPIGGAIAIIGKPNENVDEMAQKAEQKKSQTEQKETKKATRIPVEQVTGNQTVEDSAKLRVSPVAQRIAAQNNIDLSKIQGRGPGGRIVKKDVEAFMSQKPSPAPTHFTEESAYEEIPLSSNQETMAKRMPLSLGPIPHFYLEIEIDADALTSMKKELQSYSTDQEITITDIFIKACALSLKRHPQINSQFVPPAAVRRFRSANIGIAVAGEDTLLVPVLRSCACKSLAHLAQERKELVVKAQAGKLSVEDMSGGTFTISNLGMMGITRFKAVINPPQAAILAVGTIREEPVVKEGAVIPGNRMSLTLSCDHRVIDGAEGAKFLATLKNILENPLALCL